MQKTISSENMNIRTSLVNPFLYTLCLVVCWGLNLYGQQQSDPELHFIDSLNQIISSQPVGSKAQTAASEELRARLVQVARHGSPAQRGIAVWTIQQLDYEKEPTRSSFLSKLIRSTMKLYGSKNKWKNGKIV